ncbi:MULTISPECIES: MerR family transcriptional regulator [unclassified Methylobacterium]|uniref:MerR family transcriptional regulator n=1 Tax=unclassified Methylobacterium TaxID=2615210 RepID=UPI0019108707|nr:MULTISPECIES: MerR family transcriptional regulator [unclassified Methylobacterium]MCJ2102320.1 MerR family transcriptional regulator [Methylobacterium sp. E-046]
MVRSQAMNATIAAFAQAGGVGVETVRYYQRRQLLQTPPQAGGVRRYGPEDLRRLRFIRAAQAAGFTLEQVGELLSLDAGEDRGRALALAEARAVALDARIAELRTARDALRRLARACASTDTGPCPILAAFERG